MQIIRLLRSLTLSKRRRNPEAKSTTCRVLLIDPSFSIVNSLELQDIDMQMACKALH